jgi:hypothetical protein
MGPKNWSVLRLRRALGALSQIGASGPHKFTRAKDLRALAPRLRNFLRSDFSNRRRSRAGGAGIGMVGGDCASGRAQNPRKRIESFAWRNERFLTAGRKSLESLPTKLLRFARSFVFNNLTGFSFRHLSACPLPTPKAQLRPIVKRRSGSASHGRAVLRTERAGPRASALTIPTS